MDNDVTTHIGTNRKGRQRRRIIAGAVAAVVVVAEVIVGGTWQHSKAGTSGALVANVCPIIDSTTHLPSITPAPEIDWHSCNLAGADLAGANLAKASLASADLTGADVTGANLRGADLTCAKLPYGPLTGISFTSKTTTNGLGSPVVRGVYASRTTI